MLNMTDGSPMPWSILACSDDFSAELFERYTICPLTLHNLRLILLGVYCLAGSFEFLPPLLHGILLPSFLFPPTLCHSGTGRRWMMRLGKDWRGQINAFLATGSTYHDFHE